MARKNFTVATAEDGKTTLVKIEKETKVPTGKVITLEDKKKRKEEREKQYQDFRVSALKRRAKRMGLSEEETKAAVEKLIEQIKEPKTYYILLMYSKNISKLVEESVLNSKLKWLFKSDVHMYIEGDADVLATIREIAPEGTQIHPYVKKKHPILKNEGKIPDKKKPKPKTKAEKKTAAKNAKLKRKKERIEAFKNRKQSAGKAFAKVQKRIRLLKYAKEELKNKSKSQRKATIAAVTKIVKEGKKKASKELKKAA